MGSSREANDVIGCNGHVTSGRHEDEGTGTGVWTGAGAGAWGRSHWPPSPYVRAVSADVIKSVVPYLLLLLVYGINDQVHILPTAADLDCVHLYNVSALEYGVLRFHPNKLVSAVSWPVLDVLAATPYLLHYTLPVLYPALMLWRGRPEVACRFYWLLGVSMWIHYLIWFLLPTAPPWFYDNAALYAASGRPPPPLHLRHKEGCAFARLDAMTGIPFFFNLFASNPVPFASFPSGHVGWPTCILATAPPGGRLFAAYIVWVAWATLYSCHHYVSDAVAAVCIVMATRRVLAYLSERGGVLRNRLTWFSSILPSIACPMNIV